MILKFWDHCHFIITESACNITNNPWSHKQIKISLEGITTYIFLLTNRCQSRRSTHNVCPVWVMEPLLDMARSGIGKHYKCRIGFIRDTLLDKANNSQKRLILKTLN